MHKKILLLLIISLFYGFYGCGGGSSSGGGQGRSTEALAWPNGEIRFTFAPDFTENHKTQMRSWMMEMETRCDNVISFIEFSLAEFEQNGTGILLVYVGDNNRAVVGYSSHPWVRFQQAQPSEAIFKHELLHVLGLHHEFNRPDRDQHIVINWANVVGGLTSELSTHGTLYDIHLHPFDFQSLTLQSYDEYQFSANGGMTMEGLRFQGSPFSISAGDVAKIKAIYGQ